MSNTVLLNNVDHKDLKVITTRSAAYGDDVQFAVTFYWEFRSIQAHYPIFFKKDGGSGDYAAVALFGFQERENLFLSDAGWDANYIPLTIRQKPFLIGFQLSAGNVGGDKEPVIHVDLDSPRISKTKGEPVFLAHGGVSDYLEGINSVLHAINEGYQVNQLFLKELAERELLESVALDVVLNDGSQNRLMGFYTINEDALWELDADALGDLNKKGFLMPIYMTIASHSNIRELIDRKNALLER
jgi:hypothetical protein